MRVFIPKAWELQIWVETVVLPGVGDREEGAEKKGHQWCVFLLIPVPARCPIPYMVLSQDRGGMSSVMVVTILDVLGAESMTRLPGSNPGTVLVLVLGKQGGLCLWATTKQPHSVLWEWLAKQLPQDSLLLSIPSHDYCFNHNHLSIGWHFFSSRNMFEFHNYLCYLFITLIFI